MQYGLPWVQQFLFQPSVAAPIRVWFTVSPLGKVTGSQETLGLQSLSCLVWTWPPASGTWLSACPTWCNSFTQTLSGKVRFSKLLGLLGRCGVPSLRKSVQPPPHPTPSLPQKDSRTGDLSRATRCWWWGRLDSGFLLRTPHFSHRLELFKWVLNCLWMLSPFYPFLASNQKSFIHRNHPLGGM